MKSINDLFDNDEARHAQKALDYLDGNQIQHVIELLSDKSSGREGWKKKGLRPLYRNITKNIIHKSAMLYKNGLPQMIVEDNDNYNEKSTLVFNNILDQSHFLEFMSNFDEVVRILKTAMILTQYVEEHQALSFDILHRGNSVVKTDPFTKIPYELVMKAGSDDEYNYFRIITNELVSDYKEHIEDETVELISSEDNPYKMIPLTTFHDTNVPRTGYWSPASKDLTLFNDVLNMHMVDLEYAAGWMVHQELITNCTIIDPEDGEEVADNTIVGGLGKIVHLDTNGIDSPLYEYRGPSIDLTQSHELMTNWTKDIATDWSVTIKQEGVATSGVSGFSLIVAEKDNLELREQRQRMQENGLKRFYQVFKTIYNMHNVQVFSDSSELQVEFKPAVLPFDTEKSERVWTEKIAAGKASIEDYLQKTHDITREEAEEMSERIRADNFNSDIV